MKRVLFFLYSIVAYLVFLSTFVYAIGFSGNVLVEKSLDAEPVMPVVPALLINGGLILLFALQYNMFESHNLRRWWMKYIPDSIGRSTFTLLTSITVFLVMWGWQPIGGLIWEIDNHTVKTIMLVINLVGWSILFISTFFINHFDLVGLRQTWTHLLNRPYQNLPFQDPMFYRLARHPMQLGIVIALWSTSVMTVAHLFFTLLTTAYVLTAIQLEERQLSFQSGHGYNNNNSFITSIFSFIRRRKERMGLYKKEERGSINANIIRLK